MHDATRTVHHPAVNEDGYASLTVPTHRASTIASCDEIVRIDGGRIVEVIKRGEAEV